MAADSASVTDDVLREIGEQVSLAMRKKLPRWGGTAFDIAQGVEMYRGHLQTFENLQTIRTNKDGSKNRSERQVIGNSFEELDASNRRRDGKIAYTTDDLARRYDEDPRDPLFQSYPELADYAKRNHQQTDVVEIQNGRVRTIQHKDYESAAGAVRAFLEDTENDEYVVPRDKFESVREELDKRIAKGGQEAEKAKDIRQNLVASEVSSSQAQRPRETVVRRTIEDASKRAAVNIAQGVISDTVLFAVGGAAMEIREAWRNPNDMPVLERCKRLIRAIWQRLMSALKDRSLREIGSEAIAAAASVLAAPLRMATAAVEKIVEVLRRLWMDFVAGRLKSSADVVSAALKAVFVGASFGVAVALEAQLSTLFVGMGIPFGDILAALCAAVVAGVMIVLGNRAIESVVHSLCCIFGGTAAAKCRREEIEALCAEVLPKLVADRERLQSMVDSRLTERQRLFDRTFADLQSARDANDIDGFLEALCGMNKVYGAMLPWCNFDEADSVMLSPDPLKF